MAKEKDNQRVAGISGFKGEQKFRDRDSKERLSVNETPVSLVDPELAPWIRVVRPSRPSLIYERWE